jgi:hypothetical protein
MAHSTIGNLVRVVLFMLVFVVIGHWAACLFIYLGKWQLAHADAGWLNAQSGLFPWVVVTCLQFADTTRLYTAAFYWTLTTMFTVGYGDVAPSTNSERCYTMALELVAGILQGIVFGNIGVALYGFDHTNNELRTALVDVTTLQRCYSLPRAMVNRVRDYTRYNWRQAQGMNALYLLSDLGSTLKCDVLEAQKHASAVWGAPLFVGMPDSFVRALLARLRMQVFLPGARIADAGEPGAELFFIAEGTVRVSEPANDDNGEEEICGLATEDDGTVLLTPGELFGEVETILCEKRSFRYDAEGYVTCFALSRGDLDAVLFDYPELVGVLTARVMSHDACDGGHFRSGSAGGHSAILLSGHSAAGAEEEQATRLLHRIETMRLHHAPVAHGSHHLGAHIAPPPLLAHAPPPSPSIDGSLPPGTL